MTRVRARLIIICAVAGLALAARPAAAQYMPNNFHGDFGVNSGTQAVYTAAYAGGAPPSGVSWTNLP